MSAKGKLLSYIGALFVIAILIVSLTGYLNFKSASVTSSTKSLEKESFLISNALDQKIQRYFDNLYVLGENLDIDTNGQAGDADTIVNQLRTVKNYLDVVATVVALKDGTSFISTGQVIEKNKRALDREWYTRIFAGEKKIITKPYKTATDDFVMALAIPVIRNNNVVATLLVNMNVLTITEFSNSLSESNQLIVSRADGFVLAAPEANNIGENLFELQPSFEAYKDKKSSQHHYDYLGKEYVVSNARIDSLGWNVWALDTTSHINAASNSNLAQGLIFSIILILISLVIIYLTVVKLMYKPIGGEPKEIEELVKRVANGDLTLNT
ncbi:cache domain-containing protein, partial [Marinomonas sp. 5E14-1]|uniref:cache domain-containing protein n=1 Tax=Marinomonas sp. 5E14-1 TaxID=3153922 RepID=UPI003262EEE7